MPSTWQSFVPYHVAKNLLDHPGENPLDLDQLFNAVVLFSDVSGFTAISEALMAVGKRGSEELTDILNRYFTPMINLIHSYGGIIGKFGGDSMSVFFPFETGDSLTAILRSLQCAQEMQEQMGEYADIPTQAGAFSLSMKIGMALGTIYCKNIGDPETRLEYIIAGKAVDLCAQAEHLAQSGEIIIHNEIAQMVSGKIVCETWDNFSRVDQLKIPISNSPLTPLGDPNPENIQTLAAFIHPSIAQRIQDEQLSFINEHRKVTIVFVGFPGFDYEVDPLAGDKLQGYFSKVAAIIERYDGYLNKVDMGDKGSKCLIVFGAPIAHEDDAERALHCALDLRAIPEMPVNIGISTGFVFSGQVGSTERREYTVMGDSVNLAARLMQAAKANQILASNQSYYDSGDHFSWDPGQEIRVKGKQEKIQVYSLINRHHRGSVGLQEFNYALPMVGRVAELQLIEAQIAGVERGQGRIVGISAEAGMGKSRLAAEAIRLGNEHNLTGFMGECLSHGTTTSYLVWRNILRGIFELDPDLPIDQQIRQLEIYLGQLDAQFLPRLPLLGAALNIPIPQNDLTRSMDAQLRKESLEVLLLGAIKRRAKEEPLMLIFEDCHWIDPLSNDLLEIVARNITGLPVLILSIYRPGSTNEIQPKIKQFGHFTEIQLNDFTNEEAEQLIHLKLNYLFGEGIKLPDKVITQIEERAQGNPFFIDEMVSLLRDQGYDPANLDDLSTIAIPDSLHGLIISRIDQLAEDAKTTLKVASVIGRTFRGSWLWGIYPQLGAPEEVQKQLEELSRLDITPLDKPEPELEYLFKHIVTREVAYESLADSTRLMLHELAGQFIESHYPGDINQFLDLLAYHYGLSVNQQKQREYYRRAGEASQSAYANDAALDYYQRLLPLLESNEKIETMLQIGSIRSLTGEWDKAEAIYHQALNLVENIDSLLLSGKVKHAIGALYRLRGSYNEAFDWLSQARKSFENSGENQELVSTLREMGIIYWGQGNYEDALQLFSQCKRIAEEINAPKSLYRAIANIGIVQQNQGLFESALENYKKALDIAKSINDRLGISAISGNIGNVYLDLGDYAQALEHYEQYLLIATELGYQLGISIAIGNMGNVYGEQGYFNAALKCYLSNLEIALQIGDQLGVGLGLWYLAFAYTGLKDFHTAENLLQRAVTIARVIDTPYELCEFLYYEADLLYRQGQYHKALKVNAQALELAPTVEHTEIQFKAQVAKIRLEVLLDEKSLASAIHEFDEIVEQMKDGWQDEAENAAVQYEIWKLDQSRIENRDLAAKIFRALYEQTPNTEYKQRYEQLTGKRLPDPPSLPPLPEIILKNKIELDALLNQVDALIIELATSRPDWPYQENA